MLALKAFFGPFADHVSLDRFAFSFRMSMAFNGLQYIINNIVKAYANILACLVWRTELLPTRPEWAEYRSAICR